MVSKPIVISRTRPISVMDDISKNASAYEAIVQWGNGGRVMGLKGHNKQHSCHTGQAL